MEPLTLSPRACTRCSPFIQVHVGSLSDPDAFPGLAHFTEHMLFYSSEKYPVEVRPAGITQDYKYPRTGIQGKSMGSSSSSSSSSSS